MLIPLSAEHLCAFQRGPRVIHAVEFAAVARTLHHLEGSRRRTVDAVCGRRLLKMVGAPTNQEHTMVMPWPPHAVEKAMEATRCPECYALTKRPRIDDYWKELVAHGDD